MRQKGKKTRIVTNKNKKIKVVCDYCFDTKTKVFTKEGWKTYDTVIGTEDFASLSPDGHFEWAKAERIIKYKYSGDMISLENQSISCLSIPQHKVIYTRDHSSFRSVEAKDFRPSLGGRIPKIAKWKGKSYNEGIKIAGRKFDERAFFILLGWYLSEGYIFRHHNGRLKGFAISQHKEENFQEIVNILNKLNLPFKKYKNGFHVNDSKLAKYFEQFGKSPERFIPDIVKDAGYYLIKIFLGAYLRGDGTGQWTNTSFSPNVYRKRFYTSSERMAEDLVELVIKAGGSTSILFTERKGESIRFKNGTYKTKTDNWTIRWNKSKGANCQLIKKQTVPYDGVVWSPSLDKNHTLLVQRKGHIYWTGNCDGEYEISESRYYEKMRKGWRYFYCSPKCAARARAEHLWERQSPKNIPDELKREYKDIPLLPEDMHGRCYLCHKRIKKSEIFCRKHATEENLAVFEATQELPFHPRGWWSYEIIKDWLRGEKKILLKAPAGTGKSLIEDMIAYMNLTLNDGSFTLIGSISMPIAVQHIDRIREWVGNSPFRSKIVYDSKEQIKLNTGSRVLAIAQNERTRGGYHPDLLLLDEIARIRPAAYYGLFYQMGKSKGATEIAVSTPFLSSGPFIHLWYSNTAHNYSVSLKDCWFISEKAIEDARKAMSPSYFDQVFKAEFVASSNRVIPDEQVLNALMDETSKKREGILMGIDFGRKRDHTAIVVLNNAGEVIYTEIFPLKMSWREQYAMIRERVNRFNPVRIFGDATNIGDVILEELQDLNIEPVLMSNDKLKKRLVDNLLLCFSYNSIRIPRSEEQLIDQLSGYVYLDDNLVKCGPEGGAHDDLTDALMCSALGLERGNLNEREINSSWGAIGGQAEKSPSETTPWKIVW